ncbi:uncharacterized protein LOC110767888 [Prunus avium]|uniref:Uncharacterized protein LOC110767888 n=1 Tax=Prunus avium TaxID=42229 RepID=A0A6P5TJB3_PRUAV|nr:uncharacterized protein LOC110767888 [Prunus avium]
MKLWNSSVLMPRDSINPKKYGSFLYGKSIAAWLSVIERVKTAPASYILKNLQVPDFKKIKPPTLQSKGLNEVGSLEMPEADKSEADDVEGTIGIQRQESLPEQPDGIWSSARSFLSEVFTAEWMFLIVSLMLEIFSAICDQLSSPRKPLYALFGMGLAIMALATCIWEFIHKGRGKVQFGKCGKFLWWFYCPCSGTLFGTFPEICGLIYAITQWASSMVQLACVLRHKDNPFKGTIGIQRQESLPEQPDGIWSSAKSSLNKAFSAEWMFLIVSLMLEIFSAICDQLSSPRKPLYALFGMGLAIMALATCISEFIHKGRRGKVEFGKCGKLLWWFYCPCSVTLFGTFPEICGLIYAITQWASSMVQLVCVLRHKDNPFKVNILPVLFLVCLVVSKLIRNARGSTTSEMELEAIAVDP